MSKRNGYQRNYKEEHKGQRRTPKPKDIEAWRVRRRIEDVLEGLRLDEECIKDVWDLVKKA